MTWLNNIQSHSSQIGLNIFGIADGKPYQDILKGCQSVIVIANGGSQMWNRFINEIRKTPHLLTKEEHPLDSWLQKNFEKADPKPPPSRRWIRCAANDQFIDFRPLSLQAGLGHHSHLGLIIHPKYGLWISLRAAIFTTEYFKPTELNTDNPCDSCIKLCAKHCPGNAFDENGWLISHCASFHQTSSICEISCSSRLSCPIGEDYKHSSLAHHYHSNPRSGRQAICNYLDILDQEAGQEQAWKNWTDSS